MSIHANDDHKTSHNTGNGTDRDKSSFMIKVRERADEAWEYDRENREAARDDLRNLGGDQWTRNTVKPSLRLS